MGFKKGSLVVGVDPEITHNFNRAFQSERLPISRRTGKVDEMVKEWTEKILLKNGLKWEAIQPSIPVRVNAAEFLPLKDVPAKNQRRPRQRKAQ